jgi:hypothetical protein
MRAIIAAICLSVLSGFALAQDDTKGATQNDRKPGDSPHSTGRTVSPETQGVNQPQGPTGPTETTTGGAPAASPQGQTPPGMQPAPEGSSKTTVEPSK